MMTVLARSDVLLPVPAGTRLGLQHGVRPAIALGISLQLLNAR